MDAAFGCVGDYESAVERADAVLQVHEAIGAPTRIEVDDQHTVDLHGGDSDWSSVEGLGDEQVGSRRGRCRESCFGDRRDVQPRRGSFGEGHERGAEAFVGEDGGVDPLGEATQVRDCTAEIGFGVVQPGGHGRVGVVVELCPREPDSEREPDQPLLGTVVEISFEPAPLAIAGLDDAGA